MTGLHAIRCREKRSTEYLTFLFIADSSKEAAEKFYAYIENDDGYDIDKRTVSWTGPSEPLCFEGSRPAILYNVNLDEVM